MAAQIKGKAHAAELGDRAGGVTILLLMAAPAVDEEDTRRRIVVTRRHEERARDMVSVDCNVDGLSARAHSARSRCIW